MVEERFVVVLCAVPTSLAAQRLAACVNLLPGMQSFYAWDGTMHEDAECQLVIKTRVALFDAVSDWLKQHHPSHEPEILALPVEAGSPSYLEWVRKQTQ